MKKFFILLVLSAFPAFAEVLPETCPNCGSSKPDQPECFECKFISLPGKPLIPSLRFMILSEEFASASEIPEGAVSIRIGDRFYMQIDELAIDKVKSADWTISPFDSKPLIILTLLPGDAENFSRLTEKYTGRRVAIYLLGHYTIAPVILEKISGGSLQIYSTIDFPDLTKAIQWLNFRAKK